MNYIEFANVHTKFGNKNLVTYLDTIVIPAFKNTDFSRSVAKGRTKYFFLNVKAEYILCPNEDGIEYYIPVIHGRFVKDTSLVRQQFYEPASGIVENVTSIKSSPTAYFVLRLEDHRLLYYPETMHPPAISEFAATVLRAFQVEHKNFIETTQKQRASLGARQSIKNLKLEFRSPELRIIKLPNILALSEAIKQMKTLKKIEVEIVHTNDENTLNDTLQPLLLRNADLSLAGDASTKVTTTSPSGLNIPFASAELEALAPEATAEIRLSGIGQANEKIELRSDEMGVKYPMEANLASDAEKARAMLRRFIDSIAEGVVQAATRPNILSTIWEKMGRPPE